MFHENDILRYVGNIKQ